MSGRDKISTGIKGLDEMMKGGITQSSVIAVVGPHGSGKTMMSLQFLNTCLAAGKPCMYISSLHNEKELLENAIHYGWNFEPFLGNKLILKYIEPVHLTQQGVEMHLVSNYLDELPQLVSETNAEVIIIDSITDFLMLSKSEIERRSRLLSLLNILKKNGSTVLITAEAAVASDMTPLGIVEYATDGVIVLRRVQSEDLSEVVHIIQIVKLRWVEHSREIRQYDFTNTGIEVYSKYNVMLGWHAR